MASQYFKRTRAGDSGDPEGYRRNRSASRREGIFRSAALFFPGDYYQRHLYSICRSFNEKVGEITGYKMRIQNSKLSTVKALQSVGFQTIAAGDSYNDLDMIRAGKAGFLFRSTEKIKEDNPDLPAFETFDQLMEGIRKAMNG